MGTGGAALSPCTPPARAMSSGFFFGGGGAGFFFAIRPAARLDRPSPASAVNPPTLPASPYFSFAAPALCRPAATWSPCRWRKLFMVEKAARASVVDTAPGSCRNAAAVRSAACFSANVVPWLGGGGASGLAAAVPSLENRDCSSFICAPAPAEGVAPAEGGATRGFPMPSPGTETPAAPSLLMAPWFTSPARAGDPGGGDRTGRAGGDVGVGDIAAGEPEPDRGGSRGGRLGGPGLALP